MSARKPEVAWAPEWAPFVKGWYTPREVDEETGEIEPQRVRMECEKCGAKYQTVCRTGAVKTWINRFANLHVHVDPLDPKRAQRSG